MRYIVTPRRQRVPRICATCAYLRWEDGEDRSPICALDLCLIDGMGSACDRWRCAREREESP